MSHTVAPPTDAVTDPPREEWRVSCSGCGFTAEFRNRGACEHVARNASRDDHRLRIERREVVVGPWKRVQR